MVHGLHAVSLYSLFKIDAVAAQVTQRKTLSKPKLEFDFVCEDMLVDDTFDKFVYWAIFSKNLASIFVSMSANMIGKLESIFDL